MKNAPALFIALFTASFDEEKKEFWSVKWDFRLTDRKIETHGGEIKTKTMGISTETTEPSLEIPLHFEEVIIDAFVYKSNFLSLHFVT